MGLLMGTFAWVRNEISIFLNTLVNLIETYRWKEDWEDVPKMLFG